MRSCEVQSSCGYRAAPYGAEWVAAARRGAEQQAASRLSIRPGVDSPASDTLEIRNQELRAAEATRRDVHATGQEWRPVLERDLEPVKLPELPELPTYSERVKVEKILRFVNPVSRGSVLDVLA